MKPLGLCISDLFDEINYALIHRIPTVHFVVMGDIANLIMDHLEDIDIPQFIESEDDYINECETNVVYTISVATYGEEPKYFIQESYYQHPEGEVFAAFEGDICYIDVNTELTDEDLQRIYCELTTNIVIENE